MYILDSAMTQAFADLQVWACVYCHVLPYTALRCPVLPCTALLCTAMYCHVLQCYVLYGSVPHCIVPPCTALCGIIPALYCSVLYCPVVLHGTAHNLTYGLLYCTVLPRPSRMAYSTTPYCPDPHVRHAVLHRTA